MATREIEALLKINAVDNASAKIRRIGDAMARANGAAERHNQAVRRAGAVERAEGRESRLAVAGLVGGTAIVATGLQRVAGAAVSSYAELERQIGRTATTAGATQEQTRAAVERLFEISQDTAMPLADVQRGFDSLVASGRSWKEAMDFLPAVARTAQATGSDIEDIARTADAFATSMKIGGDEAELAFDKMAVGAKLGKFESKDMAQYLPSILPLMSAAGYDGLEGIERAVALLQTMRLNTGDASKAATYLENVLGKMTSEETVKKFGKMGINLREELAAARAEGEDQFTAFTRLTREATGGDLGRLKQLFTDQEMTGGVIALLQQEGALNRFQEGMSDAAGTVARDVERFVTDTQASLDRFGNSWSRATQATGKVLISAGVPEGLEKTAAALERTATFLDRAGDVGFLDATMSLLSESRDEQARRYPAAAAFSDGYERTAGRPATADQVEHFTGFAGGIVDPAQFPGMTPEEIVRRAEGAGRLTAVEEAAWRRDATRARLEAESRARAGVAAPVLTTDVPFSLMEAGVMGPLPGSVRPAPADGFSGRVFAPEVGVPMPVPVPSVDDLAWSADMAGARQTALAELPAAIRDVETGAAAVDLASPMIASADQAAAGVLASFERIAAGRDKLDARLARPLPTPSGGVPSGGVRVDVGRPMFDENSIMP